ncbi:TPA: restriction endonuclease subunit S, partial [Streptococcus suis]
MKTNNNIPAYRFQGYTDAWELRKLGEYSTLITKGTTPRDKSGIGVVNFVKVENLVNGDIIPLQKIQLEEHEGYLKRSQLIENDILFSIAGTLGRTAIVKKSILPANTNQALSIIRGYEFDRNFLVTILRGVVVREFIKKNPTIGAQPNLSLEQVSNLCFLTPCSEEQSAIGTFFSTLDQQITLHQRKLDTLKEQKKTYLKLLFPAKGQTKPVLRFRGFEDDWEEVKLGELCDIRTGKLDANAMVENGEYDFYTSGIKKYRIDVAEFEGPAITIAGNGATVGYMHLADGKFNAYQRTYVLTNFKVDRSYIFSEIAKKLPIKIQQEARTGNIPYIV